MSKMVSVFSPWSAFGLAMLAVLVQQTATVAKLLIPPQEIANSKLAPISSEVAQLPPSANPGNSNPPIQNLPEDINPNENPLFLPTQPQEVEIQKVQSISLEQALELAERNNKTLQAARVNLEAARAQLRVAKADLYPSFSTKFGFTSTNPVGSIQGGLLNGSTNYIEQVQFDGNIGLQYDIYTGGFRSANISQAEQEIRLNQLEVEVVSQQLRFDVTDQYLQLQNADANIAIAESSVKDATETLRDAQALKKALLGTKFQVLQAETDLAIANEDLIDAIAQQRIASRGLAEILSIGQEVGLKAADEIEERDSWDLSLEESIVLAYKNRAELEQQLTQIEISEQDRRIALSQIIPTVSFVAQYDFLNQFNGNENTYNVLDRGNLGYVDGYKVAAQVEWEFFDGGRARAQAEVAERNKENAQIAFADQRNQIRLQVETGYYNYLSSKERLVSTFANVKAAEEQLRMARLSYQVGVATQLDVIDSQQTLTTARSRYLQAIVGYNQALNALQRAVSNIPPSEFFK